MAARLFLITLLSFDAFAFDVRATVETAPVPHAGDAADDTAIWVHPTDVGLSTIIGTDKLGGLAVYSLDGAQLQYRPDGNMNNVDLRYNVLLGGQRVTIVAASDRTNNAIAVYKVNPTTRMLENVAARTISAGLSGEVYGFCLYQNRLTDSLYAFINDKSGMVKQFKLTGNAQGRIDGVAVRTLRVGSQVEGCVADDEYHRFYLGEEAVGIWKFDAEPSGSTTPTAVARISDTPSRLTSNVEGLALYEAHNGGGYLLASSQGSNDYAVFDRRSGSYVTRFRIIDGTIDGTADTDGIEVTSFGLGSRFPSGVFVAQDVSNPGGNQNFKLVPWQAIATAGNLTIDPNLDPRLNNLPLVDAGSAGGGMAGGNAGGGASVDAGSAGGAAGGGGSVAGGAAEGGGASGSAGGSAGGEVATGGGTADSGTATSGGTASSAQGGGFIATPQPVEGCSATGLGLGLGALVVGWSKRRLRPQRLKCRQ